MNRRRSAIRCLIPVTLTLTVFTGCATVQPNARFSAVQRADRLDIDAGTKAL